MWGRKEASAAHSASHLRAAFTDSATTVDEVLGECKIAWVANCEIHYLSSIRGSETDKCEIMIRDSTDNVIATGDNDSLSRLTKTSDEQNIAKPMLLCERRFGYPRYPLIRDKNHWRL